MFLKGVIFSRDQCVNVFTTTQIKSTFNNILLKYQYLFTQQIKAMTRNQHKQSLQQFFKLKKNDKMTQKKREKKIIWVFFTSF